MNRDEQGNVVVASNVCFNCGERHSVRDCKAPKDEQAIRQNSMEFGCYDEQAIRQNSMDEQAIRQNSMDEQAIRQNSMMFRMLQKPRTPRPTRFNGRYFQQEELNEEAEPLAHEDDAQPKTGIWELKKQKREERAQQQQTGGAVKRKPARNESSDIRIVNEGHARPGEAARWAGYERADERAAKQPRQAGPMSSPHRSPFPTPARSPEPTPQRTQPLFRSSSTPSHAMTSAQHQPPSLSHPGSASRYFPTQGGGSSMGAMANMGSNLGPPHAHMASHPSPGYHVSHMSPRQSPTPQHHFGGVAASGAGPGLRPPPPRPPGPQPQPYGAMASQQAYGALVRLPPPQPPFSDRWRPGGR
eukprot:g8183.t1